MTSWELSKWLLGMASRTSLVGFSERLLGMTPRRLGNSSREFSGWLLGLASRELFKGLHPFSARTTMCFLFHPTRGVLVLYQVSSLIGWILYPHPISFRATNDAKLNYTHTVMLFKHSRNFLVFKYWQVALNSILINFWINSDVLVCPFLFFHYFNNNFLVSCSWLIGESHFLLKNRGACCSICTSSC